MLYHTFERWPIRDHFGKNSACFWVGRKLRMGIRGNFDGVVFGGLLHYKPRQQRTSTNFCGSIFLKNVPCLGKTRVKRLCSTGISGLSLPPVGFLTELVAHIKIPLWETGGLATLLKNGTTISGSPTYERKMWTWSSKRERFLWDSWPR